LKDRTLADDRIEKVKQLTKIAEELNTTMATLAIAWCIHNTNVTTAILGATKESQLQENLKALDVLPLLTGEVIERIELVMNNKPIFV
jgi:aryl-alcohol dehydrogenase-like predicted oxidoreductase